MAVTNLFLGGTRNLSPLVTANVQADAAVVDLSVLLSDSPDLHCNEPDIPRPSVAPGVMYVTSGFNSQLRRGLHRDEYVVRNGICIPRKKCHKKGTHSM